MLDETTSPGFAPEADWDESKASQATVAADEAACGRVRYASPEALFRAERDSLVRVLTLACGDPALAEDSVQEAFARLFIKWKRIGGYDDPAAWVRRVALNLAQDHRRHLARRARLLVRLGGRAEDGGVPPLAVERDPALWRALRGLPSRQRAAVALFYLGDLRVAEVAAVMKVSEGTVKRHLDRAREALRTQLEAGHER